MVVERLDLTRNKRQQQLHKLVHSSNDLHISFQRLVRRSNNIYPDIVKWLFSLQIQNSRIFSSLVTICQSNYPQSDEEKYACNKSQMRNILKHPLCRISRLHDVRFEEECNQSVDMKYAMNTFNCCSMSLQRLNYGKIIKYAYVKLVD